MRNVWMLVLSIFLINCVDNISIEKNMDIAQQQYTKMLKAIDQQNKLPRTTRDDGNIHLVGPFDWTSGFFPGSLWYLYEYTQDEKWKNAAQEYTEMLSENQFNDRTHDTGFMMYCSYGNGYRLTKNDEYRDILIQTAKTLCTRFNPKIGCIKSWDWNKKRWQYPVIIDNMMNLELLMWAFKETGDSTFRNIAVAHANTTMKNHFRDDMSTWHVVDYDTLTGEPRIKQTWQGLSDSSAWSRGQSWGLYGYTMMYRETDHTPYLELAEKIANFILTNDNMPEDLVPYWDYDVKSKDEPRDASAAAIMASALFELSQFSSDYSKKYLQSANKIIRSLSSEKYLANPGENKNFILKHSVGNKPGDSEIDVPLNYADYYFLEALMRKEDLE